jgi:hypothetical protein
MHYVKIMKLIYIFEVIVKEMHIKYKIHLETSIFYIICINHNEEHYGGCKSSMFFKLENFTVPWSKHQTSNCNISLNFKIFFQKFKNGLGSKLCKLCFVD